ncbi:MAG: hypothetical protein TREMPRED_002281 [Tremellales sp. Tagirdzhanova-0007]|nr:MAG: hypothetical protein TREMPRED_002281 [Tremellales sp. Tagirdzhanova-0007]
MRSVQRLFKIAHPRRPQLYRSITSSLPPTIASSTPSGPSFDPFANDDFLLYPSFFNLSECRQLIKASLWKLDRSDTSRRRRRNTFPSPDGRDEQGLQDLFHGEYGFEEGHFDSVINHYRESLLSSFPPPSPSWPDLIPLLNRAYALLPSSPQITNQTPPREALTHLLHLAPKGEILPHVDNLDASGGIIVGICLGAERILRLKRKSGQGGGKENGDGNKGWDVVLPNGSIYVQSGKVRYGYEHSILPYLQTRGVKDLVPGHRISIMIRDAPEKPARL